MAKQHPDQPTPEPKEFKSADDIDLGISKLERRIRELEQLDVVAAVLNDDGKDDVATSNVREIIRDVFGTNSPEFKEHEYIDIWAGAMWSGMTDEEIIEAKQRGRVRVVGVLNGLIGR